MQCTICLDTEGDVIQRGCCCRGDAGAVHLDCLIELANAHQRQGDWGGWTKCEVCKGRFTGHVQIGLGRTWFDQVKDRDKTDEERSYAAAALSDALYSQGRYEDAAEMEKDILEADKEMYGVDHPNTLVSKGNLATTLNALGRHSEAADLQLEVLTTRNEVLGPEHPQSLISKSNLASVYVCLGQVSQKHSQLGFLVV